MIEDIRKTALAHAMELARLRCGGEASNVVKDASVFEDYLTGAIMPPINKETSVIKEVDNLLACSFGVGTTRKGGKAFPGSRGKACCHKQDQPLTGCGVPCHKNDSSQKENNCDLDLPTPGSTETVIPSSGTVTDQGTHGRTDGGA